MKRGFSFIELILVVILSLTITGLAVGSFSTFTNKEKVRQARATLKSDLRLAQAKAGSGKKPAACAAEEFDGYEVIFTETAYQVAPYCSVSGRITEENQIYTLLSGVVFSPVPETFRFYPLTRGTSLPSDVTITLTWAGGAYPQTLTVGATTGVISD